MHRIEFLAACIIIPAAWGVLASWAYDWIAARQAHKAPHRENPPDESSNTSETCDDGEPMYYI